MTNYQAPNFDFSRQHKLVLDNNDRTLSLGPNASLAAVLQVQRTLGEGFEVKNLSSEQFDEKLTTLYGDTQQGSVAVMADMDEFLGLEAVAQKLEQDADLLDSDDHAPIIKFLNAILLEALTDKASDIHIEPYERQARIRFRLDGVLRTVLTPSVQIAPLLISRIKVMARLDIAERRLPQDGRMSVKLGGRSIDLRVSTLPSSYGERVVMRLLDKHATHLSLNDLGMAKATRDKVDALICRPHGIILVTGPTGSGKTTTLYAALEQLDRQQLNIMTVEDPVEYDLQDISQTQINTRAGMTFAKGLRALLRQDPDVILIGEIRDSETAEIATQASLTGHLVFATLHTNSASGAITRLQDLGVDSLLLSSTVRGILAQRLVRSLCDDCKIPQTLTELQQQQLELPEDALIFQKNGCQDCNHTGYKGRLGVFELVLIDESLQKLIHDRVGDAVLEKYIRTQAPSILNSGYQLVIEGRTSMEEVLRVTAL